MDTEVTHHKLDIDTAYHYLELRFESKGLRVLGAVMFIIYQVGRMSIIMYLPCMVLGSLTGISIDVKYGLVYCQEFVVCGKCAEDRSDSSVNVCQKEYQSKGDADEQYGALDKVGPEYGL